MSSVDASLVLRAVQSRLPEKNRTSSKAPRVTTAYEYEPFQDNHQQRMGFRRLINPGIIRNNPDKLASKALQLILRIAENILMNPGNDKFMHVNRTGERVKTLIMELRGTVELMVEMGFSVKSKDHEQLLLFNPKHIEKLRIGTSCLKEILNTETNKNDDAERELRLQGINEKAAKTKVINRFYDDRLNVKLRLEREKTENVKATEAIERQVTAPQEKVVKTIEYPSESVAY